MKLMGLIKKLIKPFLVIILLLLFILFLNAFWEDLKSVRIRSWSDLAFASFFFILLTITNGYVNNVIWRKQQLELSFHEWYGLNIVNTFANFILPMRGGLIPVATYLNKKHNYKYSSFITFLSAIYIIVFWVNSLAALIALIILYRTEQFFTLPLTGFLLAVFASLTVIILFSPKVPLTGVSYIDKFLGLINDWHTLRKIGGIKRKIALFALINVVIISFGTYFQFRALGYEITFLSSLILGIIGGFSLLLSITPGNIGVKEGIVALTSSVLGVPAWQTVVVGVLDRIIGFTIATLIAPYFLSKLSISLRSSGGSEKIKV